MLGMLKRDKDNAPGNGDIARLWDETTPQYAEAVLEYHQNNAYLDGKQWLEMSRNHGLQFVPEDGDRIQATINRMRSNDRSIIADLTKEPLPFEVMPSAADDATIRASKIAETLLEDLRVEQDWEVVREDHIQKTRKGGTAVVAVDWSTANKTTKLSALSVCEFVVEPGARDPETARWWIKLQLLPPEEAQATFPEHFPKSPPAADGTSTGNKSFLSDGVQAEVTRVFTYYERPNPATPEGLISVEVGGVVVQRAAWPFPWSHRLNFALARETLGDKAFGTTSLSDVRSPQSALNAAWSGFLEHLRQTSNHRIIADSSWMEALGEFTDEAGEILYGDIKGGGRPEYLKAPPIPPGVIQGIAQLELVIDDLMGIHDVRRGEAPANIESGYGLQILTENDSTAGGRMLKEVARVWSRVGWMVLEVHQTEVKSNRTSATGTDATPARRKWKGSDLLKQTRAIIARDAIVPKSRAAQRQWAQQALEMGLINGEDPLALVRFAQLADMPDQKSIINSQMPDAAKAIRENEAFVQDEPAEVADFDDHEIHMAIHNDFRKTIIYEQMEDVQRKDADDHIMIHEHKLRESIAGRRLGEQLDPALGQAAQANGAPPLDPLPPEELVPEAQQAAEPLPEISPEQMQSDILAALEQQG